MKFCIFAKIFTDTKIVGYYSDLSIIIIIMLSKWGLIVHPSTRLIILKIRLDTAYEA